MKLRNAARFRKVILKFLPHKFERHRNNTSFLKFKGNVIHWHVEWIFFNAENTKTCDERIPENQKISTILTKYFELQIENPLYEKLQYYQAVGLSGVKVFLKAEGKRGNKYYQVDINSSLKEVLCNKIIIEYPTFHVVLKDHAISYEVIDSGYIFTLIFKFYFVNYLF